MQVELNEQERQELVKMLRAAHGELNAEVHHAMAFDTRDNLREERALVDRLLQKLSAANPVAA
jgi:hypothetical protein